MAKEAAMRARAESKRTTIAALPASRLPPAGGDRRRSDLLMTAVLAAFEVALEALQAPALIVGQGGEVVCSNAAAAAVLGGRPRVIRGASRDEAVTGLAALAWEVTPIRTTGEQRWSLMISPRTEGPRARNWNLTTRQREVLELVARGMTNADIAEALGIRLGTVEFHISAIFDKVGVDNRAALIAIVMGG